MGDSIKAFYDDYEDYTYLCEESKEKPLGIHDDKSFYDHMRKILDKFEVKTVIEYNIKYK